MRLERLVDRGVLEALADEDHAVAAAGLLQAIAHATAKAGMFMAAGLIYAALGHDRIDDLAGDGDHYAATVTAESFRAMSRVARTRAVYAALGGRMGGELHALQLTTAVPS